jgi:hypothetical protein
LARHSHPGRTSEGFLTISLEPQRLRLDLVFPHQICSVPAHIQKSKEISKEQGRIYFSFLKTKERIQKRPYSYKEKHFKI